MTEPKGRGDSWTAPASQRGAAPPGLKSDSDEGPPPQAARQARLRLKSGPEASGSMKRAGGRS
jgi:hypothetical protein